MTRVPCLKRAVRCVIARDDGRRYYGQNLCEVSGLTACPRAGLPTGEGYELCRPVHAEQAAAILAADSQASPGTAYLYGHDYLCMDCQHALTAINVRTFVIVPEGSQP